MSSLASRRSFLAASAAWLATNAAQAERSIPESLTMSVMSFDDPKPFVRRASVLAPTYLVQGAKVPVLILMHGLGEAKQGADVGTFAWIDRYGAASSFHRLRTPPIASVEKRRDLTEERAKELADDLAKTPFAGMVLVCPFTPNVWSYRDTPGTLDALAEFLTGPLLERVGSQIPQADVTRVGIDGCSLGGFVSLEIFTRAASHFGTLGVLQPAIDYPALAAYADKIEAAKRQSPKLQVHIETSTHDPYLDVSKRLAKGLATRDVPCDLRVPPGSHDQSFLREVGTLEMLLWHDRALRT